jgi:hypothetical protein
MKTFDELKSFYDSVLYPELEILEKLRIQARNKIYTAAAVTVPLALLILYFIQTSFPTEKKSDFMIFLLIFCAVILGIVYHVTTREYVKSFKTGIIEKLVKFIDENLSYSKMNFISRNAFMQSKIFQRSPDIYKGDDHVSGKVGQTQIEFSEIHAKYVTRDSKGRRTEHTIFKGLFFIADFNKNFKGKTVVLPDTAERLFGQFGSMLQSLNKFRGQLIKLEDPEFEKMFAVYGDDQVEARYILSTSLMKRIADFKKSTRKTIYLSFIGSKINIAISYAKDLFEPKVFTTMLDFAPIKEYYNDFMTAVGIVEDLNLNTRIWSK